MNFHILSPLRKLLRKTAPSPVPDEPSPALAAATGAKRTIVIAPRSPVAQSPASPSCHNGKGIELPLQAVLAGLSLELQPRLIHTDVGALTIAIPLEKVLAQLSSGLVRISFGELRQVAPNLFTQANDLDRVMVPLPLGEILSRLNPALITRRRVQKQVAVPADIASPFGPNNRSMAYSISPAKPPGISAPGSTASPRQVAVPGPKPMVPPARSNITFAPTPAPPTAQPPVVPAMSFAAQTLPDPNNRREPTPTPVPAPGLAAPKAAPAKPATDSSPLQISITALAEGWPEAVRQELVQLNLIDAKVLLPAEIVERALKQGRIAFTWKTLRSWIKPTPLPSVSAHDNTALELPLKVIAPLFLARQKTAVATQRKVTIDEDIPDLFFGFPTPEAGNPRAASVASAAPAKMEDTNFYVWNDSSDTAHVQEDETRRGPSPGTKFVAKYATPNEVVSRAAGLDGVAGALIALPDGLMVASRLAPDLNGDTLAAFLPQIFGKVSQCTRELRMGDLNNVNFTVGNIPWKIFRVNAIFFAAFGRAGVPLPTAQLAALAAELDHKPK